MASNPPTSPPASHPPSPPGLSPEQAKHYAETEDKLSKALSRLTDLAFVLTRDLNLEYVSQDNLLLKASGTAITLRPGTAGALLLADSAFTASYLLGNTPIPLPMSLNSQAAFLPMLSQTGVVTVILTSTPSSGLSGLPVTALGLSPRQYESALQTLSEGSRIMYGAASPTDYVPVAVDGAGHLIILAEGVTPNNGPAKFLQLTASGALITSTAFAANGTPHVLATTTTTAGTPVTVWAPSPSTNAITLQYAALSVASGLASATTVHLQSSAGTRLTESVQIPTGGATRVDWVLPPGGIVLPAGDSVQVVSVAAVTLSVMALGFES